MSMLRRALKPSTGHVGWFSFFWEMATPFFQGQGQGFFSILKKEKKTRNPEPGKRKPKKIINFRGFQQMVIFKDGPNSFILY
jgi:hypothetical protein